MKIVLVICLFAASLNATIARDDYNQNRMSFIKLEILQSLGGKLRLTDKEQIVNTILMHRKKSELEYVFNHPQYFNFSKHYLTFKDPMKKSRVYKMVKMMPKGALLHVHASLMLGADYLMKLTYEDHLYVCLTENDLKYYFSETIPQRPCPVEWTLLADLRNATKNISQFDANLRKYFTIDADDHISFNTDENLLWEKFRQIIGTISSLISYRPVREKAFYQSLQNCYDDGILYVEIRTDLYTLYELNGTKHDRMYMVRMHDNMAKQFMEANPDFVGVKLIYSRSRTSNVDKIQDGIDLARRLKQDFPDFFAGFDLVGQEDAGRPLKDFSSVLIEAKDALNYYFHAGETNWYGTTTDENLIDAVLLGTKRIGHAYALLKHPAIIAAVSQQDIAIEVNVISNAVLSLVKDLRNHPLASFLALGLPVVLSSDDPGVWDAEPLTDDFYLAFVAIASKHADLRMLKQLAINSVRYSALGDEGKTRLFRVFEQKWDAFLDEVIVDDKSDAVFLNNKRLINNEIVYVN